MSMTDDVAEHAELDPARGRHAVLREVPGWASAYLRGVEPGLFEQPAAADVSRECARLTFEANGGVRGRIRARVVT